MFIWNDLFYLCPQYASVGYRSLKKKTFNKLIFSFWLKSKMAAMKSYYANFILVRLSWNLVFIVHASPKSQINVIENKLTRQLLENKLTRQLLDSLFSITLVWLFGLCTCIHQFHFQFHPKWYRRKYHCT